MDFPITDLMDRDECIAWIREYFHPEGLKCPHYQADIEQASWFRRTKRSLLDVYRCQVCQGIYNLYSGTVFEGRHFRPEQTVLFIREVCQGKSTAQLARELGISRTTATEVRHKLQANAEQVQLQMPLDDLEVEMDEMFQNAGEKSDRHGHPDDPPRRRANKRRGRGTYDNDRPPVCAVMGRESRQVRIRVMKNTPGVTLCPFVERFTKPEATIYTDE